MGFDEQDLPCAPAAERNFRPILGVLQREFVNASRVLEIGAGTGQHAAGFAEHLSWLRWQPTDCRDRLPAMRSWHAARSTGNLDAPLELDVAVDPAPRSDYDAAFSANTAHIMSVPLVRRMFDVVGSAMVAGGRFCLYGPFREGGVFNAPSNERFDASLRASDACMGIREMERLDRFANAAGLVRIRRFAMPGNNLVLVYERTDTTRVGA